MYSLLYTICISTAMCITDTSPLSYNTLERCQQQGAILSGQLKAQVFPPTRHKVKIEVVCSSLGEEWKLEF